MNFTSLAAAALHFNSMRKDLDRAEHEIIRRACVMVWTEARRVLGTDGYNWPALSPETLAHKTHAGMLLETGEMRESLEWTAHENEGWVGSNNDKAVWHELGTAKSPPRSFLMGAARAKEAEIHAMAAKAVAAVVSGGHMFGSEMREFIHAVKQGMPG